jgi:hypothetical protein
MSDSPRLQVRVSADLERWIADRAERVGVTPRSTDLQLRAELEMWREGLALELARIGLSVAEASALADVVGGPLLWAGLGASVRFQAEDAFRIAREADPSGGAVSSYGAKHGIDEGALLVKLAALGPVGDHALADALSRWWASDGEADAKGFRAVGIRVLGTGDNGTPP